MSNELILERILENQVVIMEAIMHDKQGTSSVYDDKNRLADSIKNTNEFIKRMHNYG